MEQSLKIDKIQETEIKDGFSAVVFGDSGAGKTTLLDSLPVGKILIISIEGGLDVLQRNHSFVKMKMPSIRTPNIFTDKLTKIYQMLRYDKHDYDYVAIDSSSEMEKFLQYSTCCKASKAVPSIQHYGVAATMMRKYIMEFRDLKKADSNFVKRPINPIFIASSFAVETLRTEDRVTTRKFPMLSKKFSQEICGLVDVVIHIEIDEQQNRLLRVYPTQETMAKTRYRCLKNLIQTGGERVNFYEQVAKPVLEEISEKGKNAVKETIPASTRTPNNKPKTIEQIKAAQAKERKGK